VKVGDIVLYYHPRGCSLPPSTVLLLELVHKTGRALVMNEFGCHWISLGDVGLYEGERNENR
jgi:hypothetical protein